MNKIDNNKNRGEKGLPKLKTKIDDGKKDVNTLLKTSIEKFYPKDLPASYVAPIKDATNSGFGINLDEEDIKNHLFKSDIIYVIKNNGTIVGFSSLKILKGYVYRFGTVISGEYQGKGLYKLVNKEIVKNKEIPNKGFLRTQNRNIIKSFEEMGYTVLKGEEAHHLLLKDGIKEKELHDFFIDLDGGKDFLSDGIFKGVYGSKMGVAGKVSFIDDTFYSGFDPDKGDSLLVTYTK